MVLSLISLDVAIVISNKILKTASSLKARFMQFHHNNSQYICAATASVDLCTDKLLH